MSNTEYRVRIAKSEDYDSIAELLRQLNPEDASFGKIELGLFLEILASNYLDLIVAEIGTKLVGTCYLSVIPNLTRGGKPYAVIENVVTDSAHRTRGIGSAMLDFAVNTAWEKDCYKVMLMSGRNDPSVHAFYRKCGFDGDSKQAYIQRKD